MKIFSGGIGTETNTFSSIPTGYSDFPVARRMEDLHIAGYGTAVQVWHDLAREHGDAFTLGLYTFAQPAGLTTRAAYEALRGELLDKLRAALPVDMVLLMMHGAMVADGYDDCETDLVHRVREIVGPNAKIGVELDLHCDLSQQMIDEADVVVLFKEYPHTDVDARADEVFKLTRAAALGEIQPVMALHDCRMLGTFRTPFQPMRAFVDGLSAREGRDGVLSVSLAHSFPWADVPSMSVYALAVADGDRALAQRTAREVGEALYAQRQALITPSLTLDAAIDAGLAAPVASKPVVIADTGDNAGGGAPSDSTFVLRALLQRGVRDAAVAMIWDPIVVQMAHAAGPGARLNMRLGGKMGPTSGEPLDGSFVVRGVQRDLIQQWPQLNGTHPQSCGDAAWLEIDGLDVIVNARRCQVLGVEVFTAFGIDPAQRRMLWVKSSQHFYAAFAPIASRVIYAATPGTLNYNYTSVEYKRLDKNKFPWVGG